MSDISLETVTGKLNRVGYDAFMQALRQAKNAGNRNLELAHWLHHILANERSDISLTVDHFKLDKAKLLKDIASTIDGFRKQETEMPGISTQITDILDRGWYYATLFFGETQIRTGHLLVGALKSRELRRALQQLSPQLSQLNDDIIAAESRKIWGQSDEDNLRPMDGSGLTARPAGAPAGDTAASRGTTALDRFSVDMTAAAAAGKMDPVVGRDDEIRQIIDVLMRRRQNNPILTGEAGVGKTAAVEGFAQRLADGDVPPQLKGVRLCALDIGLMQAGASMKGEFEQRLRSVIDEVQASPTPIILFIDEAHTLIGAGGAQGTGDAANLLKPALARGTLRTIGATTWAEYRQYFEKDPALTRRFQPVNVDEPAIEKCVTMLRGILEPMEKHHGVRISDEAVVAAVSLSARYIPARQLPDKAVSLLDTACARVAISQSTTPAAISDLKAAIEAKRRALAAQERESELGRDDAEKVEELKAEIKETEEKLAALETDFARERAIVDEIMALRKAMAAPLTPEGAEAAPAISANDNAETGPAAAQSDGTDAGDGAPAPTDPKAALGGKLSQLDDIHPDSRMIYAHVDEQAVASVVSDWTGIPVGRMVKDEVQTILQLAEIMGRRVVGQSHGLSMIAKRIETNRAKLDNPNKPIGVFMLCGPSGVGKTETALALAESLYGGEQNMITINMSEFQEAHTVSALKGAPPGYVGYGEGGRLTEAVRRKPYSVVLLDEVEKAHPDVHELFFQVFDKGQMEDGTGRRIDFKNTLIILTSNVGTEVIMQMAEEGKTRPDPETLNQALRPSLLQVFPPALLGRLVTIPYFPLSGEMLGGIVRLQLDRIKRRIAENHDAEFNYSDAVVEHIVSQCRDPDSGGRMIDNIITNTLLPELSRHFLNRAMEKLEISRAAVDVKDGAFAYEVG
ncbi:type VI secretion system ATPase TssH [Mesorhizobium sp. LHD-90]|uniref:type VI secretion system ATPase TssH n=1 Tax=Mesorhizobium sp. LHD-90 TaxID=3071414 RepID=UPI0027DEB0EF|nr:type VI secretion system ATPase TssH [Mesorhizobium sp. LHD-90]MDQ6434710.1 type VI secretion system ATPase TssH [Mesorhizobium sp. LHD-90]